MKKNIFFLIICLIFTCLSFSQVPQDKQKHFIAGASIAGFTYTATYIKTQNHKKSILYSILSSVAVGTLKELSDMKEPNNHFDGKDLLATSLGGITIGVTLNLVSRKKKETPTFL